MDKLVLIIILFIAATLRFYGLFAYPVGFTPDEASFAYDAFSILKTGKDQWGHTLPLVLESFGDFKLPLLTYFAIPFVASFGLVKEAVRIPNALFGVGAVIFTYLLAGQLGKLAALTEKQIRLIKFSSSFLLAISPWHVMMSRGGFEANLTTCFMTAGVYLFLKGLENKLYYFWSALLFGLNLFSYHSARLLTPIIFLFLLFTFRKELIKQNLKSAAPYFLVFMFFLALAFYTLTVGGTTRAKDISIANGAVQEAAEKRLYSLEWGTPFLLAKLLHNKYQVVIDRFINNYTQYSSYDFLYKSGPSEATYGMIPGRGVSFWFEFPFLIGAIFTLYKLKNKKPLYLLLLWFLTAPIPAALTTGRGFAANRAEVMLPSLQLIEGFGAAGIYGVLEKIRTRRIRIAAVTIFALVITFTFISFIDDYFFVSPKTAAQAMLYGDLETAYVLKTIEKDKREIIVSKSLSEPHIYIAFANEWDPEKYQMFAADWDYKEHNVNWVDQLPEYRLGKYIFKGIDWKMDSAREAYIVGRPGEFPASVDPLYIIKYPNGDPAVYIVDPGLHNYAYYAN